ncbi:GAF domain-containing protein [Albimonas pacifica]|nr:GAF domain-containing protein [Albimonas pacifica]
MPAPDPSLWPGAVPGAPAGAPAPERALPSMDLLRNAMEGVAASALATCDAQGMVNVSIISQVHYVDPERVALSYQFFNKTRRNLLSTGRASVAITDPATLAQHRLQLVYEETRTEGPLFEQMRAQLMGLASHSGMDGVFRLRGADVFRVVGVETVRPPEIAPPAPHRNLMAVARRVFAAMAGARELGELFDLTLERLAEDLGVEHAMILMHDEGSERLYTVASRGYSASGVGSEVALGEGVVGVAARERAAIRIGHLTSAYGYARAIRDQAREAGLDWDAATAIPFPGLGAPSSQLALPILRGERLLGVLLCESRRMLRFCHDDEDALALIAGHLGALAALLPQAAAAPEAPAPARLGPAERPPAVTVRHFAFDDSVFLDNDYLIKGVAGAILWRLLREHAATGREEFNTRELRLDPSLRLPDHAENLDARLVLLRKRLDEREAPIRIEKSGRGRFRLCIAVPVELESAAPPQA